MERSKVTVNSNVKKDFLENFQNRVIQGRRLLQTANHRWADKLLSDLYYDIEKTEWLDIQKKHQLIMIIANSWWMYINSLTLKTEEGYNVDIIRYIDAYKRFFSFLAKLDDFYLFNNFATELLKIFIQMDDLSQSGITKFINSFSIKLIERQEYIKLLELQIVLMFLRKSVIPQEYFHLSMEHLGRTIFKLEPQKRGLFIHTFLENVNSNYELMEDSNEFIIFMHKVLTHRIPGYLKDEFSNLPKIVINKNNFDEILVSLEDLIFYLNNIGEYQWIISIIKNLFYKVKSFKSYGDAVTYIRKFIYFTISRNRFEIAFEIYDFLESLFMYQGDLGYDNILIELWVEACKKFVDMKEKKYLLQSLEKLNTHLKLPQNNAQIYHYFYTSNFLWIFKSLFFSLEQKDFWRMMFYRSLYEEKDFELANKILSFLDKNLTTLILNPIDLYNETESLKKDIYSFESNDKYFKSIHEGFVIKQIIFRINSEGVISYRMISSDNEIIEGKIEDEYWNDAQILEIYYDIFSDKPNKKYNLTLHDFGRILYIFLPRKIRSLFKQIEIKSLRVIPEIYFILDSMTVPFELLFDNNFFLLKYSISYIIGEPPLGGITFGYESETNFEIQESSNKFNVLIIDCINSTGPLKWNEESKSKELVFPFEAGVNEFEHITEFFNQREEIAQIAIISGTNSTRENILSNINNGSNHIIHFVGNIFYSKWNPHDSFLLTNNNEIITFDDIDSAIRNANTQIHPFLFFNSQIFNVQGKKLRNVIRTFGEMIKKFDYDMISGIISKNYPIFDNETKEIVVNFYINLFNHNSQGISLLKARQVCMANKMTKIMEDKVRDLESDQGTFSIDPQSSLAISSYMLFGKPWKKLD
ncbi:MAG: hypothetical protein EAX89_12635 [Candidatus Lokiarchaeota archaeon]|nr:hypothetical protein [Candidatus Lokiarchaeota archaeon]